MVSLFGWQIEISKEKEAEIEALKSITPEPNDGSIVVETDSLATGDAFTYSTSFDVDTEALSEFALITKYREISRIPEIEFAIEDIINAMVSTDENNLVDLDLDELEYAENLKRKIIEEFNYILNLLDFNSNAYEILRAWYVDGRLPYQVIIDQKKYKEEGIGKLVYVDPRQLKKVRVVKREKDGRTGADVYQEKDDYYIFSESGFGSNFDMAQSQITQGIRMSKESIVFVTSGILNPTSSIILSHLHKAIRVANQLRSLEDAAIIYRLSRAPERRVFYIDVGNLPPAKAEQVLKRQMQQYRSKMVYDTASGTVRSDPRHLTMIEDYWLPRRSDGKATEITTLPGGQNLGEMEEVNYFLNKLYKALNVPASRLDPQAGFNFGRVTEINRDEVKFMKFVGRLRKRFSGLFLELLKRQLALKNILNPDEFDRIRGKISFEFRSDNIFEESKQNEIINGRLDVLEKIKDHVGTYYSMDYVRRNILHLSQEDIDQMELEMNDEEEQGLYDEQESEEEEKMGGGFGGAQAGQPMQLQLAPVSQEKKPEKKKPETVKPKNQ